MAHLELEHVDPDAVLAWCDNSLDILDALHRNADKVPFHIPPETIMFLVELVTEWRDVAARGQQVEGRAFEDEHVRQLVTYWFNVTKLSEDERDLLGISFTPPAGRSFADALAAGVADAMTASPALADFAARLETAWRSCQPAFGTVPRS